MTPVSPASLAAAAAVGLLSGTHAAIWGAYKDSVHEGFGAARFARSVLVGAAVAALAQWVLGLPLPRASALVVLFGLAYAAERGVVEVWKTFVREEDQSKYFIPMQFSIGGRPVRSRALRLGAGVGYVIALGTMLAAVARLDLPGGAGPALGKAAALGLLAGLVVAVGGAWKDAPKEGFDGLKFLRSPAVTTLAAALLAPIAPGYLAATVAAVGFERAVVETYKTFLSGSAGPGKFSGMPVRFPEMLVRRRRLVPAYVLIWAAVAASGALAVAGPR